MRLEAAFRAVELATRRPGPRKYGSSMPEPVRSFEDKVERKLEDWIEDVLEAADRRVSQDEIAEAERALEWIRLLSLEGEEGLMRDAVTVVSLGKADPRISVERMLARRRREADRRIELESAARLERDGERAQRREEARLRCSVWEQTAKLKPVRAELVAAAVRRKRARLKRSGWVKSRTTAKSAQLTEDELEHVVKARNRGIEKSARAMLARMMRAIGGEVRAPSRPDVMPGRNFYSRQLYDRYHLGCGLIAARLNEGEAGRGA